MYSDSDTNRQPEHFDTRTISREGRSFKFPENSHRKTSDQHLAPIRSRRPAQRPSLLSRNIRIPGPASPASAHHKSAYSFRLEASYPFFHITDIKLRLAKLTPIMIAQLGTKPNANRIIPIGTFKPPALASQPSNG